MQCSGGSNQNGAAVSWLEPAHSSFLCSEVYNMADAAEEPQLFDLCISGPGPADGVSTTATDGKSRFGVGDAADHFVEWEDNDEDMFGEMHSDSEIQPFTPLSNDYQGLEDPEPPRDDLEDEGFEWHPSSNSLKLSEGTPFKVKDTLAEGHQA